MIELIRGVYVSVSATTSLKTESESLIAELETFGEIHGNMSFRRTQNSVDCLIYNVYKCLLIRFELHKYAII